MAYFVTGGTGFLGRNLIDLLLRRDGTIHVLVRAASKAKFAALVAERWPDQAARLVAVTGDLAKPRLGVAPAVLARLKGTITQLFHLGAIYDLTNEDQAGQAAANVEGTRHAVGFAEAVGAGCFHHTSSIAAAGLYRGWWREDMFHDWAANAHPYYQTKHEAERIVRDACRIPWRIYRPGVVIGHSQTGEIDKIDGPYIFFKLILQLRRMLPQWVSLLGIEGGFLNIVPVDYVTAAMDALAHKQGLDRRCFHLTNPKHHRVGEVVNIFARAAGAPEFALRIDARMFNLIPPGLRSMVANLPPVRSIIDAVLGGYGIPRQALRFFNYPTRFENRETAKALKGTGIACPPLAAYAGFVWDYWERHLNPELFKDRSLAGAVRGRVVVVTGGTSGIGLATAEKIAGAGATTVICARKQAELDATQAALRAKGLDVHAYSVDVADPASCDAFVAAVLRDHGRVDILVNNAGRSIRRSVHLSYDRFHDFERTMAVNYFGALRLIMGFLPRMAERKFGQIINVLSIGVQVNQPRFSAYVASKAALGAFARCAQPEFHHRNITFTNVYMPLVRTPMIAPTKLYDHIPTLNPDQAADLIVKGIIERPKRVATRLGNMGEILWAAAPDITNILFNTTYRLFPDSAAAQGAGSGEIPAPSGEAMALAALTSGLHW